QPQQTVLMDWSIPERYSQICWPLFASRASTSSLPVETYMTPSWTSGVASNEYLEPIPDPVWATQAAFNVGTLDVSIWFNVEYRVAPQSPPMVSHWLPAGSRRLGAV